RGRGGRCWRCAGRWGDWCSISGGSERRSAVLSFQFKKRSKDNAETLKRRSSATRYQRSGSKNRRSKSESRKTEQEPRPEVCAAIPPLRNGRRRRCSGRDDEVGSRAIIWRGRENRAEPLPSSPQRKKEDGNTEVTEARTQ